MKFTKKLLLSGLVLALALASAGQLLQKKAINTVWSIRAR